MLCKTESERISFIQAAINDHQSSPMFKMGEEAGSFYRGTDRELEQIQQLVYDRDGKAYNSDRSNHKLTTNLFFIFATQLVSYLLGNGISFDNPEVKEKLGGAAFDYKMQRLLTYAFCDGESYAYVDEKGVTPLCYACKIEGNEPLLVPLKDERDGVIRAAIWYWRLAPDKPLMVRLFEEDSTTLYQELLDENGQKSRLQLVEEKKAYKQQIISSEADGIIRTVSTASDKLPIVPLRYINGQSELHGKKTTLFAYDVVYSGLVNNIDMNKVYWIIRNADGMDKRDDMQFVADIIHNQAIHEPEGVEVRKEEIQTNESSFINVLAALRAKLFTDAMAVDVERDITGNITTVEIKSKYQNLNLKCDRIEQYIDECVRGILRVAGLDENEPFHLKRPNDINTTEYVTMLMQISPLLGEDTSLKLVCETLGLVDEYEDIKAQREAEVMAQMQLVQQQAQQQRMRTGGESD